MGHRSKARKALNAGNKFLKSRSDKGKQGLKRKAAELLGDL